MVETSLGERAIEDVAQVGMLLILWAAAAGAHEGFEAPSISVS